MSLNDRIQTYNLISSRLSQLNDDQLSEVVQKTKPLHTGIGGTSALLTLEGRSIFVKRIALTDLERHPQNYLSTANLFNLPLYYQYGVGSTGFGAGRELRAHQMTTEWVLNAECPNFPILFHWRVLPCVKPEPMNANQKAALEKDVRYWENSSAIRARLEALHAASAHVVLFLEYVPKTLSQWLKDQVQKDVQAAQSAISFVELTLQTANNFMKDHGLIHFDAHFENILTDGELIILSDFGLALSTQFDLTPSEIDFMKVHASYDQCATIVNLMHTVVTALFGKDQWESKLDEFSKGVFDDLPPYLKTLLDQHLPTTLRMDKFYKSLINASKLTPFPVLKD